jgi:hypothetical protein
MANYCKWLESIHQIVLFFPNFFMSKQKASSSPAYDLVPAVIAGIIPGHGYTINDVFVTAYLKWFTPDADWTWYVTELDPDKGICYGVVSGLETEWGTFTLQEVQQVRGSLGLPVERDLHFEPTLIADLNIW